MLAAARCALIEGLLALLIPVGSSTGVVHLPAVRMDYFGSMHDIAAQTTQLPVRHQPPNPAQACCLSAEASRLSSLAWSLYGCWRAASPNGLLQDYSKTARRLLEEALLLAGVCGCAAAGQHSLPAPSHDQHHRECHPVQYNAHPELVRTCWLVHAPATSHVLHPSTLRASVPQQSSAALRLFILQALLRWRRDQKDD